MSNYNHPQGEGQTWEAIPTRAQIIELAKWVFDQGAEKIGKQIADKYIEQLSNVYRQYEESEKELQEATRIGVNLLKILDAQAVPLSCLPDIIAQIHKAIIVHGGSKTVVETLTRSHKAEHDKDKARIQELEQALKQSVDYLDGDIKFISTDYLKAALRGAQ